MPKKEVSEEAAGVIKAVGTIVLLIFGRNEPGTGGLAKPYRPKDAIGAVEEIWSHFVKD